MGDVDALGGAQKADLPDLPALWQTADQVVDQLICLVWVLHSCDTEPVPPGLLQHDALEQRVGGTDDRSPAIPGDLKRRLGVSKILT